MDALAAELGMSKKTLYIHFESKNALLEAVLKNMTLQIHEGLMEILNTPESFHVKFHHFIYFIHGRMAQIHPCFLEDVRLYAAESWRIIEEFRGRMIPVFFGQLLDEGIKAGFLKPDLNRPLFLRLFLVAVQGMMNPAAIMESGMAPRSVVDGIMSIFFEGILTPVGRKNFNSLANHD